MSARFEGELKKRIGQEIERLLEELELGVAVKDYADYKKYVGRLAALRSVTNDYCGEVQTKLNQE